MALAVINHAVILAIIYTTNLAHEGVVGLILNFTAAYILSELDDIMYLAMDR